MSEDANFWIQEKKKERKRSVFTTKTKHAEIPLSHWTITALVFYRVGGFPSPPNGRPFAD